ncbi:hypothetical protein GM415_05915 [Pseudodesulfovibrio cashew]|uniref:Uncharacterized protein n=1 Tax=Pseudodesulfovibrio cashew TaxID=2678688 RepID=A0A6I6JC38_9BACT|nr:hypothetical protein [Pseudodesulfovibrio cashew]QGY39671.1 hypothetical protein GM415_05915 [Pseudodesulfovibrio cashew]
MTRLKSAIIVFVVLAGAILIAVNFDYTDTYVAKRFNKALKSGQYDHQQPFSLDAFLEYYDWDAVCVVRPGAGGDFKTRGKLPYRFKWDDGKHWALVFTKSYYVVAEIPFDRNDMEPPDDQHTGCYERWQAIVRILDKGGVPQLHFVE